ncbi:MAG: hypothetical protein DKT66_27030 [Candidatus Melainabacteria bacterium]|nr:MAG: hypothetical protein DKT66_27030 [Candidatus Melainabacteria bacterium]
MTNRNARYAAHCALLLCFLSLAPFLITPGFCLTSRTFETKEEKLPESAVTSSASDYLNEVAAQGWYRWPTKKLPLKVFFLSGKDVQYFRDSFVETLKECFSEWSAASAGKIAWTEHHDQQSADIVVRWSSQVQEGPGGLEGGRTKTYSKLDLETNIGTIYRAEMVLLTRPPDRELTDTEVRKAYLHEVGHALGIAGHSTSRDDIMYFAVSDKGSTSLGLRDKATINKLYSDFQTVNSVWRNLQGRIKHDQS